MADRVEGVATAVPAFIGRTGAGSLAPTPISSLADYQARFGSAASGISRALALFYANGGGDAWVVPVATEDRSLLENYESALARIGAESGPTLLLAPDALDLPRDDYYALARAMIAQGARLGDRMAILDIHGGGDPEGGTVEGAMALVADFGAGLAPVDEGRSYGAAYFPWIVRTGETHASPPSAAIAGLYAKVDASAGPWQAPANASLVDVLDLAILLDEDDMGQTPIGVDKEPGVNAIRYAPGLGALVWGARTLDGNSADYRYVSVRRTLIYIEQSVKRALAAFAPLPNRPPAWARAEAMVEDFLTGLWRQGAIEGSTSGESFLVTCGPSGMLPEDLLSGVMRMEIRVALSHPAEFTLIVVEQQLQPPE